jgi:hypothetical protein
MMRVPIVIDTMTQCREFVKIVTESTTKDDRVYIESGDGLIINAKSLLGVMYSREFNHLYCVSEKDISGKIVRFIVG